MLAVYLLGVASGIALCVIVRLYIDNDPNNP